MLMRGSQIVMECLLEQGVDTVFGYPGGTILNIYDEFELHGYKEKIHHYLTSHEQDTILNTISTVNLDPDHGTKAVIVRGIQDVILVLEDGSQMPLGLGGYLDLGIADTMEDLLVNFIGAVVFSAIGFIYVKTRGRSRIAPQFIPQVLDVPEEAEEDSAAKAGGGAAQEGGVEKLEE